MPLRYSKHTQSKIITGYILLFLLSLTAAIFIFRQITRLAGETGVNTTNQKLLIISNTITGLYEAEALSNAFILEESKSSFQKYMQAIEGVSDNIDSLRSLTTLPEQKARIDSINALLIQKIENLKELVWVKRSMTPDDFYYKTIASIEAKKDSLQKHTDIRKRPVMVLDSTFVRNEKKKKWRLFSKKEPDSILKVSILHNTITDTVNSLIPAQNTDSIINLLKSTWSELQEETENINRQVSRKEFALIKQSNIITDQLRRTLGDYEQEELHNSLEEIRQKEDIMDTTGQIIAWSGAIAFLIIISYLFFILKDLSRSQRYRRELEQANQYTAELLKSREKLILTVTHDIKSPLGSIMGYIELLNGMPLNPREKYFLKNMKGSSEHILKLVTNLLDFSKLENNKMEVEEVIYNPYQLVQEISDSFLPMAAAKKLHFEHQADPELNGEYKGDALRIRQIVGNILSNAIKYTSRGDVHLTATYDRQKQNITIRIKDTGPGMSPEEQKIIFQEFTRLTPASAAEGTGLGLTITLKLVQLLGGELALESEPGKGSCFTLSLPLKPVKDQAADNPAQEKTAPAPLATGNPVILLVDDDPLQLEMTAALLDSKGIHADITTEPEKVPGLLKQKNYNLIFTDIQMPGMDGFTLVQQIRNSEIPGVTTLPVIALSANPEQKENDYLEAGFTAYLSKPFTPDKFFGLIARFTGSNRVPSESVPLGEQTTGEENRKGYSLKNILQYTENDPEATRQVINSFIRETLKNLKLLKQLESSEEYTKIARLAHKMLPLFRQLEVTSVVSSLQRLERPENEKPEKEETSRLIESILSETGILLEHLEKDIIQ